jgi:uncharacterized membrane protein (UPF0127 family)
MKITNHSKGKVLAERAELAESFWKKAKGLMFIAEPKPLLMDFGSDGRPGIWMPFMRFPIDIVYIGRDMKVVDIKENCRPLRLLNPLTWKVFYPKEKARYVLELEAGLVRSTGTEVGDVLRF